MDSNFLLSDDILGIVLEQESRINDKLFLALSDPRMRSIYDKQTKSVASFSDTIYDLYRLKLEFDYNKLRLYEILINLKQHYDKYQPNQPRKISRISIYEKRNFPETLILFDIIEIVLYNLSIDKDEDIEFYHNRLLEQLFRDFTEAIEKYQLTPKFFLILLENLERYSLSKYRENLIKKAASSWGLYIRRLFITRENENLLREIIQSYPNVMRHNVNFNLISLSVPEYRFQNYEKFYLRNLDLFSFLDLEAYILKDIKENSPELYEILSKNEIFVENFIRFNLDTKLLPQHIIVNNLLDFALNLVSWDGKSKMKIKENAIDQVDDFLEKRPDITKMADKIFLKTV